MKETDMLEMVETVMSPEQINWMRIMTYKIGILQAVYWTNGSKDPQVLAEKLFELKKGVIPIELFRSLVDRFYSEVVAEGMIQEDGRLTPYAVGVVSKYEELLQS